MKTITFGKDWLIRSEAVTLKFWKITNDKAEIQARPSPSIANLTFLSS
ncbi:hypothetical protein [Lactonifactor longoviformis]|nr:hypothetical protein [Lactonifactor longoviformis]